MENISLTVTYRGEDYKVKTKDLELDGLKEVKVSVFEQNGKVETSTESAPDDAKKIAKFKVDLENWTVIAMPKPEDVKNVDAFPLDTAAQKQVEAPAGSVQLIQDFKDCKGVTDETKGIRTLLKPDGDGVYFASRWDEKLATKEGVADRDGAIQWAVERKAVPSASPEAFDFDDPCSRGAAVIFMWQAAGSPEAAGGKTFTDVPGDDAELVNATAWAVKNGVTTGTGDGTAFPPSNKCTRGQIVTFLCRAARA